VNRLNNPDYWPPVAGYPGWLLWAAAAGAIVIAVLLVWANLRARRGKRRRRGGAHPLVGDDTWRGFWAQYGDELGKLDERTLP
jgi:hypothetical protein